MRKSIYLLVFIFLLLQACDDKDPDSVTLINPTDANALSQVLIMPDGTQRNSGAPPSPSNSSDAPTVNNLNSDVLSSNGATAPLNFDYSNVNGNLSGCYVQITGASSYFTIPYNGNSNSAGQLQVPLGLPVNVDEGNFEVNFCVYDNNGFISNIVTSYVTVLRLGTGTLQISLSWNNISDQDLYVTDPNGEIISYINSFSSSGGQLDRDDVDGYGPENIFWQDNAPNGTYNVKVNDFDGTSSPTTFYVTVNGPNTSRNFTGTTVGGNTADVVTFTKNGDNISF